MNASDRPAFSALFDRLKATWSKPTPSDRELDAARKALDEFPIEIIEAATNALITAAGRYAPSTSDLRAECLVQRDLSTRQAPVTVDENRECVACDGVGQVQTRTRTYTFAVVGHAPQQKTISFWAPCPHCAKGQRLAYARSRPKFTPIRRQETEA